MITKYVKGLSIATAKVFGSPITLLIVTVVSVIYFCLCLIIDIPENVNLLVNLLFSIIAMIAAIAIQFTQNKDSMAVHTKLDEVIHSIKSAQNEYIDIENLEEKSIQKLKDKLKLDK